MYLRMAIYMTVLLMSGSTYANNQNDFVTSVFMLVIFLLISLLLVNEIGEFILKVITHLNDNIVTVNKNMLSK